MRAASESWTRDLILTKDALYHWAKAAIHIIYITSHLRAEDGAQTRDPQLGRLVLYRLSYFRMFSVRCGWWWIRTTEGESQQIYSLPHLATLVTTLPFLFNNHSWSELLSLLSDSNQRPRDYKSRALANWAKEAFCNHRQIHLPAKRLQN